MTVDNRRATRLACDFPSRLLARGQDYAATVLDLSRTGVRLRLAGRLIGVHRLSTISQVGECVEQGLGTTFDAELHYPVLGPLIAKSLTVVRVGRRDWESADVEIGCALAQMLADEEAAMLGLAPAELGSVRRERLATPPAPPIQSQAPHADEAWTRPLPSVRTDLVASSGHKGRPLRCETEGIESQGLIVRVPKPSELGLPTHSVTALAIALGDSYGTSVQVSLHDGDKSLWSGPARMRDVEIIHGEGGSVRLGLSFSRPLNPGERASLGLR